ncbi:MAG: DUF2079 domain-containing protein [Anaerolineae bacterium]|nr:DUF2079 domain-containing protein [Anaerolineae bacterium]
MDIRANRRYWRATLIAIAVYIIVFTIFTIGRYERYNATGFDLAFYDHLLWRTAHGDIMQLSLEYNGWSNWAFHVEPILLLMAPFKLIFTDVRWMLLLQTIALAIGAIPVYRIAVRQWKRPWIGFVFAVLYLIYPALGWINKFDFHPLAFATAPLLFALDAAENRRFWFASFMLLIALLCKEEVGFVVAMFGLYLAMAPYRWRPGLAWIVIGIAWALVSMLVIIPGAQGSAALPQQAFWRYKWLFYDPWDVKLAYITGPDTPLKLKFLAQLLFPFLFTSLLAPRTFMLALPILGLSLLSTTIVQSGIYHQYMADVIPFLVVAAIRGSYRLWKWSQRIKWRISPVWTQRLLMVGMVAATLVVFLRYNPFTTIPPEPYGKIWGWENGASLAGLQAADALVPKDGCIAATNNIAPRYAQRKELYVIGSGNFERCDLMLLDTADFRWALASKPEQVACLFFNTRNYHPIFYQDNVVMLKRNAAPNPEYDAQFKAYCDVHG